MHNICRITPFLELGKNTALTIYDVKFVSETPKHNTLSPKVQVTTQREKRFKCHSC